MPTAGKQAGRPAGLLINPIAAEHHLGQRPRSWLAGEAKVANGNLTEILSGKKGCGRDIAERLAIALEVPVGLLFPELATFTVQVRHFTAPKVAA